VYGGRVSAGGKRGKLRRFDPDGGEMNQPMVVTKVGEQLKNTVRKKEWVFQVACAFKKWLMNWSGPEGVKARPEGLGVGVPLTI